MVKIYWGYSRFSKSRALKVCPPPLNRYNEKLPDLIRLRARPEQIFRLYFHCLSYGMTLMTRSKADLHLLPLDTSINYIRCHLIGLSSSCKVLLLWMTTIEFKVILWCILSYLNRISLWEEYPLRVPGGVHHGVWTHLHAFWISAEKNSGILIHLVVKMWFIDYNM